jgi:hypothetical protein
MLETYLEESVKISDKNFEKLEKKFELLENNAYQAAEALALLYNPDEEGAD